MFKLPSGRQVAIPCQIILKMAELNAQTVDRYLIRPGACQSLRSGTGHSGKSRPDHDPDRFGMRIL